MQDPSHLGGSPTLDELLNRYRPVGRVEAALERARLASPDPTTLATDEAAHQLPEQESDADNEAVDEMADASTTWMQSIQRASVPAHDEHLELARKIEAGIMADAVLRQQAASNSDGTPDELAAIAGIGRDARTRMIEGNLRLVLHWSNKHRNRGLDVEDVFQYGCFGLMRAVDGWDWRRGYTFSTYASWWIRQTIERGIANDSSLIRVPVHAYDAVRRIRRHPDAESDVREDVLRSASAALEETIDWESYSEMMSDECDRTDASSDPAEWMPGHLATASEVGRALAKLSERDRYVITMRAGCFDEPATLDAIGKELGLTRERIRQIEKAAAGRLCALMTIDQSSI